MTPFQEVLNTHFRFYGENDNLPYAVRPRRKGQTGRMLLARLLRDLDCRVGAEIGVDRGASARLWCETMPNLHLTCIDPWGVYAARGSSHKQEAIYREAQSVLAPFNVTIMREKSMDVVGRFENGSLDFVHIDGDHTFDSVVMDIIHWVPKVREGGVVLCHDYIPLYRGGVIQAIDGYTNTHMIRAWYVTHQDPAPTAFWQR